MNNRTLPRLELMQARDNVPGQLFKVWESNVVATYWGGMTMDNLPSYDQAAAALGAPIPVPVASMIGGPLRAVAGEDRWDEGYANMLRAVNEADWPYDRLDCA